MFFVRVREAGGESRGRRQVDGSDEFCQEFFDDGEGPLSAVVGEVNGGWAVASRQLFHERNAVGGGSPYFSGPAPGSRRASPVEDLIGLLRRTGRSGDPAARELAAEFHALGKIGAQLVDRVTAGMRSGQLPPAAGSLIRLFSGDSNTRPADIALELAGPAAVIPDPALRGEPDVGVHFIARKAGSLRRGRTAPARDILRE